MSVVLIEGAQKANWLDSRIDFYPHIRRVSSNATLLSGWKHVIAPYKWWIKQENKAVNCKVETLVLIEIPENKCDVIFEEMKEEFATITVLLLYFETVWNERRITYLLDSVFYDAKKEMFKEKKDNKEEGNKEEENKEEENKEEENKEEENKEEENKEEENKDENEENTNDVKREETCQHEKTVEWNIKNRMPNLHTLFVLQDRSPTIPYELLFSQLQNNGVISNSYKVIHIVLAQDQKIQFFYRTTDWIFDMKEDNEAFQHFLSNTNSIEHSGTPYSILLDPKYWLSQVDLPEPPLQADGINSLPMNMAKTFFSNKHQVYDPIGDNVLPLLLDGIPYEMYNKQSICPYRYDSTGVFETPVSVMPKDSDDAKKFWNRTFRVWGNTVALFDSDEKKEEHCAYLIVGSGCWNETMTTTTQTIVPSVSALLAIKEFLNRVNTNDNVQLKRKEFYINFINSRLYMIPVANCMFGSNLVFKSETAPLDSIGSPIITILKHEVRALCVPHFTTFRHLPNQQQLDEFLHGHDIIEKFLSYTDGFFHKVMRCLKESFTIDCLPKRKHNSLLLSTQHALETLILTVGQPNYPSNRVIIPLDAFPNMKKVHVIYQLSSYKKVREFPKLRQIRFVLDDNDETRTIPFFSIHATPAQFLYITSAECKVIIEQLVIYVDCCYGLPKNNMEALCWMPKLRVCPSSSLQIRRLLWRFCMPGPKVTELGISESSQVQFNDLMSSVENEIILSQNGYLEEIELGYGVPIASHKLETLRNTFTDIVFGSPPVLSPFVKATKFKDLPSSWLFGSRCLLPAENVLQQRIQFVTGISYIRLNHPPKSVEELENYCKISPADETIQDIDAKIENPRFLHEILTFLSYIFLCFRSNWLCWSRSIVYAPLAELYTRSLISLWSIHELLDFYRPWVSYFICTFSFVAFLFILYMIVRLIFF